MNAGLSKRCFFEKKKQKTFVIPSSFDHAPPANPHVMPAQAGIHDFFAAPRSSAESIYSPLGVDLSQERFHRHGAKESKFFCFRGRPGFFFKKSSAFL
jgi:hypothetical protein